MVTAVRNYEKILTFCSDGKRIKPFFSKRSGALNLAALQHRSHCSMNEVPMLLFSRVIIVVHCTVEFL